MNDGWRYYDVGNVRHFVRCDNERAPIVRHHEVNLDEGERQLVLMALAQLAIECPGFDYALNEIACKVDNVAGGRATLYDNFRETRSRKERP